jgi:thiosulfate/3-mercaptopyruvate sulfurtransferase
MKKNMLILGICFIIMAALVGCNQTNKVEEVKKEDKVVTSTLTVEDLIVKLEDENIKVLDTRPSYVYNGWKGTEEETGGHIPGAINFSASWLSKFENDEAIKKELDRITISSENEIVLYGDESSMVSDKLSALGYKNIKILEGGFEAWTSASKEVAQLENYKRLVYPEWVNDLISLKEVEAYEGSNFKIFEVSWGEGEDYEKGHIPGAVHINTDEFEEEPIWNRKSDTDLEKAILANGITKDTTVILYGPDTTASARIAVILKYAGVEDVRILDGGYNAWVDAGLEIEKGKIDKIPVEKFGATIPVNKDYIIDMQEAKEVLANENSNLISIRSWEEYIGETSGYSYIEAKGRIAGDIYGEDTDAYRNVDGTMFNYELMKKEWNERGIDEEDQNSFYCGTGWRAAETLFYADLMGWENISLYDGGWYEWSSVEGNPIEVGEPKQ